MIVTRTSVSVLLDTCCARRHSLSAGPERDGGRHVAGGVGDASGVGAGARFPGDAARAARVGRGGDAGASSPRARRDDFLVPVALSPRKPPVGGARYARVVRAAAAPGGDGPGGWLSSLEGLAQRMGVTIAAGARAPGGRAGRARGLPRERAAVALGHQHVGGSGDARGAGRSSWPRLPRSRWTRWPWARARALPCTFRIPLLRASPGGPPSSLAAMGARSARGRALDDATPTPPRRERFDEGLGRPFVRVPGVGRLDAAHDGDDAPRRADDRLGAERGGGDARVRPRRDDALSLSRREASGGGSVVRRGASAGAPQILLPLNPAVFEDFEDSELELGVDGFGKGDARRREQVETRRER